MPKTTVFVNKPCKEVRLTRFQKFISISSLLGISAFIGFVFMILYYLWEQVGIAPFLGVFYIDGLSEGENWILFITFFILSIFIPILIIWCIYRYYREKNCTNIDESIEKMKEL